MSTSALAQLILTDHSRNTSVVESKAQASTVEKNADSGSVPLATVARPEYLAGLLSPVLHGLVIQDLDGTNGEYELIAWSQRRPNFEGFRSRIELIAVKAGASARRIWQSPEEELFEPRIKVFPDWQYQGHQVYLVLRQAGAAWCVAEPLWIKEDSVHKLPSLEGDAFEITELKELQKHQLICHHRPGPQTLDIPEIYLWNGESFVDCSKSYPQYYSQLADSHIDLLSDKDTAVCNLYGESLLLEKAGRTGEALALLKKIRKDVLNSKDPELVKNFSQLLSRIEKNS